MLSSWQCGDSTLRRKLRAVEALRLDRLKLRVGLGHAEVERAAVGAGREAADLVGEKLDAVHALTNLFQVAAVEAAAQVGGVAPNDAGEAAPKLLDDAGRVARQAGRDLAQAPAACGSDGGARARVRVWGGGAGREESTMGKRQK